MLRTSRMNAYGSPTATRRRRPRTWNLHNANCAPKQTSTRTSRICRQKGEPCSGISRTNAYGSGKAARRRHPRTWNLYGANCAPEPTSTRTKRARRQKGNHALEPVASTRVEREQSQWQEGDTREHGICIVPTALRNNVNAHESGTAAERRFMLRNQSYQRVRIGKGGKKETPENMGPE